MKNQPVFFPADILLPKSQPDGPVDLTKWSTVACDQYTSEPEYWKQVETFVGDAPSALHLTFPEIYLEQPGRIASIQNAMDCYLKQGLFQAYPHSLIYLERTLADGAVRKGLVGMVDLEQYSYAPGSQSLIRATEGTVLERIPPRVRIREHALLELPHVMLLMDDREKTVLEPLSSSCSQRAPLYDFSLMQGGGSLKGYLLEREECLQVQNALDQLADPEGFGRKYGVNPAEKGVLLFAVGDGNHSLAAAKACFEQLKGELSPEELAVHPARYALVELVNLQEDALTFEPIHRVLFQVDPAHVLAELEKACLLSPAEEAEEEKSQCFRVVWGKREWRAQVKAPSSQLTVGSLQNLLDAYLKTFGGKIDYIHGEEVVRSLAGEPGNLGFLLPGMEKDDLFPTVLLDGVLPRKTFSMGHAWDKRFYLECRRIQK